MFTIEKNYLNKPKKKKKSLLKVSFRNEGRIKRKI